MALSKGLSLRAQLYLLIGCLSIFTFGASLYNNVANMRGYLNEQLASHAQGAAHNLGLSISPYMDEEGLIIAETMTNVIFDSGYYQSIRFIDLDEKLIFERVNPVGTVDVPDWFISFFALHPPLMVSEVSDGWRIAGRLEVQSHAGTSYQTLYEHSESVLFSTLLQLFIALIFAYLILKSVLVPLKSIEQQATDVIQKKFNLNTINPFTTELKTVVNAINNMVSNIQRAFTEQTQLAEKLSKEVYLDSHTGLPNRRALLQKFETLQSEAEVSGSQFYLGLVSMTSLKWVNEKEGYGSGDEYISEGAGLLHVEFNHLNDVSIFRISGSEFAILSQGTDEVAVAINNKLTDSFSLANSNRFDHGFAQHAMTRVNSNEPFSDVVKRLDTQITLNDFNAASKGSMIEMGEHPKHSREKWITILHKFTEYFRNEIFNTNAKDFAVKCIPLDKIFDLMLQPVIDDQQNILYVESFVRFKYEGDTLPTVEVFAMAERLGLLMDLEQAVVCFIFYKLKHIEQTRVAVNISDKAFYNKPFTDWLFKTYQQLQQQLPPIMFEFNENAAITSLECTEEFIAKAKSLNVQVAIERFGSSLSSFCYIRNFDIDFIKIDGSYIRDLAQADTQFFVQTVTQICHGIGIKIIAPQIESTQIAQQCSQMNIDGLQGNGLYSVCNFNTIILSTAKVASPLRLANFNLSQEYSENDA